MTKRKYTVTAKVLEANRWKLELARLVEPAIRFRVSERRRAACRANLVKARAVLRAASLTPDGHPRLENRNSKLENRNSKFETGKSNIEKANSAPQDVTPSAATSFDSRVSNFDSIHRRWPDSPAYGTRLTRGLCAVSLRRSARLIGESAAGFDRHVARFLEALRPRDEIERNLARGIAETVWRRLRVFRGQANWERGRLLWLLRPLENRKPCPERSEGSTLEICPTGSASSFDFRISSFGSSSIAPATRDPSTMVELALELAWGIDEIFSTDADLFDAAGKLNVRLERLTRQWITVRGGEPRLVQYATSPWPRDARLLEHAPAIMGNPFVPPSRIEVGLAGRPAGELRPLPEEWRRSAFETRNSTFAGLRRLSDEGQTPNPIDTCEKLGELWEGAMEAIHSLGHLNTDNTVDSHIRSQSTLGHRQSAIVDALWRRLSLYRDLAEREAAEVEGLLEAKIAGRMGEDFLARLGALPPGASLQAGEDGETAAFLMELVLLFNRVSIGAAPAGWREASDAVDEELFRTLVARFGPNREFDALRPGAVASLMKAQRQRRRAELTARLAKADQLERRRRIRSRRTGCKGRGRRPRVTTIKQLKRAEQRYADVRELLRLDHDDRAAKALEMEGDPPAEPGIEEKINGLEWSVRFFAALGAGLLKREG